MSYTMHVPKSSDKEAIAPESEGLQVVPEMRQDKYLVGHRTSVEQPEVVPSVVDRSAFVAPYEDVAVHTYPTRKRSFGLPKTWFVILIISAVIVIVGAIAGGVLGSKSHEKTVVSSLVIPLDIQ